MAIGCGAKCAKALLFLFNFIFWLSGAALLSVGIWVKVDPNIIDKVNIIKLNSNDPYLELGAYLLIGMGVFVFIVGFCGCCGAIKESKCMLGCYMFLMILVMLGEIGAGAIIIIYKGKVDSELRTAMTNQIKFNYTMKPSSIKNGWDKIQREFKCCGVNNGSDYIDSSWYNEKAAENKHKGADAQKVPNSCCYDSTKKDDTSTKCQNAAVTSPDKDDGENYHGQGCYDNMKQWFDKHALVLILVALCIAFLEIVGIILACCLCRSIGEEIA